MSREKEMMDGPLRVVCPQDENEENMRSYVLVIFISLANVLNNSHGPAKGQQPYSGQQELAFPPSPTIPGQWVRIQFIPCRGNTGEACL